MNPLSLLVIYFKFFSSEKKKKQQKGDIKKEISFSVFFCLFVLETNQCCLTNMQISSHKIEGRSL